MFVPVCALCVLHTQVGNATSATQAALERRRNLGIHQEKKVKRQAKPVEMPDIDWMPLFEEAGGDDAKGEKPLTWEEIQQMNKKRRSLLALARETSPISTPSLDAPQTSR